MTTSPRAAPDEKAAYITQAAAEIAFERSVVAYHEASMRMQLQVRHTTLP